MTNSHAVSQVRWGIDLGGTKIEGVVLDGDRTVARTRIPTEASLGYDHIVAQIGRIVALLESESSTPRPTRIGIGTPGTRDPGTGLMKNCNTTALNGRPLLHDISSAIGVDFAMANDANCFALAEATMGAARGYPTVFGVIMGTGVGGGVVIDGKVLNGAQGIGGEWGHNHLEDPGLECYCGLRGCVETVLSGPFLERHYESLSGVRKPLAEIAREEDDAAIATISRLCEQFGKGLSSIVNVLDPHAIVIGGGVGNIEAIYTRGRDELEKWVFNNRLDTMILKPALGDSAGVFGAAMLV